MSDTGTFQIVITIVSLILTVATSVFLAMITYMMRRRDKEYDRLTSRVDSAEAKNADQDVKITAIQGEIRLIGGMMTDIREIRESTNKMSNAIARIEQKLADSK